MTTYRIKIVRDDESDDDDDDTPSPREQFGSNKPAVIDEGVGEEGWRYALLSDDTIVYEDCPHCEEERLVNAKLTTNLQYEGSGTSGVSADTRVQHALCNNCWNTLYDETDPSHDKYPRYL